MKIIVYLTDEEASRQVEDDDENVMEAYRLLIKKLEQVMGGKQIRYLDIEANWSSK
jgi:hypothetical protein